MKKITTTRKSNNSRRVQHDCSGVSKTKQEFKNSCDINLIMARALKTGIAPQAVRQGYYADVSDVPDLAAAFEIANRASEAFQALPAEVRRLIDNDPSKLGDFISNKENFDLCVKHGLLTKIEKPADIPLKGGKDDSGQANSTVSTD